MTSDAEGAEGAKGKRQFFSEVSLSLSLSSARRPERACASPYYRTGAKCVILSVLAPSYDTDGKSLDESSKIGVMNQSYSWSQVNKNALFDSCSPGPIQE